MRTQTRLAIVVVGLSALLSGMGVVPAKAGPAPKTYNVAIKGFKFTPETLEVNAGDTVVWKNEDIVPHIVTADAFHSKNLDQGESWTYQAKTKGDFHYICKYHPTMKAELIVH